MKTLSRVLLAMLIASLLGVAFGNEAVAAPTPSIAGTVTNGTTGNVVGGIDVVLTTFIGSTPAGMQTTAADDQGSFQFSGLSTNTTYSYSVYVIYQGVRYNSALIQLTSNSPIQTVGLKVYETTDNDAKIQVSSVHAVLSPSSSGVLNVVEVWNFVNSDNMTFTGKAPDHTTALFSLPPGATNFSANAGITANTTTRVVTDVVPIIPGANSVAFFYSLGYQGTTAVVTRKMDYTVPSFSMLIPEQGVTATSTTLQQATPQSFQGVTYLDYTATNLTAGQGIDITLTISSAAPAAPTSKGTSTSNNPSWAWVLLGILGSVLVVIIIYYGRRRQKIRDVPREEDFDIEESVLIRRLARLDDEFDSGEIAEKEYTERRAKLKEELVAHYSNRKGNRA